MKKLLENQLLSMEIQVEQMRLSLDGMKTLLESLESQKEEEKSNVVVNSSSDCKHPKEARQEIKAMGSKKAWICSICDYVGEGE
jgi:rubrerythrin